MFCTLGLLMPLESQVAGATAKRKRNEIARRLVRWGRANYVAFPWRRAGRTFHALVAEILLQRTRAEQVVPVYQQLCVTYPSASSLSAAPPSEVRTLLKPLGLHWRIPLIQRLAAQLGDLSSVPLNRVALCELPGVGDYAAAAFLSLHCGRRASIVDSNVVRLYGRLFGFVVDGETRRKKWFLELAAEMTPVRHHRDYNYAVLDFTRAICRPKPLCESCPLIDLCDFGSRRTRLADASAKPIPGKRQIRASHHSTSPRS
jgi:A/G-specific adenine glycosylase